MEWLFKEDNYVPPRDKDRFIDKSIFSLLNVLSIIKKMSNTHTKGFMYSINPCLKFMVSIFFVTILSVSRELTFILILDEIILAGVLLLNKESIKRLISLSMVSCLFTSIILLPSIIMGNVMNSTFIILKIFGSVLTMGTLSYSTKWNDITKALKLIFVPDIFIFIFDITLRYIFILAEMSMDMLYALKLRCIGKNNNKYISISSLMGSLFIRSKFMGDEMLSAMECRGFMGEYKGKIKLIFSYVDFIYVTIVIGIIIMYISFGR